MEVRHTFGAGVRFSVAVSEYTGDVHLYLVEGDKGALDTEMHIRIPRSPFNELLGDAETKLMQADRVAATKRGEAVPAAPVSDGEAAAKLLRTWAEAANEVNRGSSGPLEIEAEKRAFLAAAAFVGLGVAT